MTRQKIFQQAQADTIATLREGDQDRWAAYQRLDSAGKNEWRKQNGHAEFCRLQRLDFHGAI